MTLRTRAKKPAELKVDKQYQLLLTKNLYSKVVLAKRKGIKVQKEMRETLEARLDELLAQA
jgi:hypothetical protein